MEVQDLMKPRYKVIADYPQCSFIVGEILTDPDYYKRRGQDLTAWPHLFKPLAWWEEREIKDMPEYVKENDDKIIRVVEWQIKYGKMWMNFEAGKKGYGVVPSVMCFFEPATESDYLTPSGK